MSEPGYLLSAGTARKVSDLLKQGPTGPPAPALPSPSRYEPWVRVTGAAVSGWYPAVVTEMVGGTWTDYPAAVEVSAANGQTLTSGTRYKARQTGPKSDGTPRFLVEAESMTATYGLDVTGYAPADSAIPFTYDSDFGGVGIAGPHPPTSATESYNWLIVANCWVSLAAQASGSGSCFHFVEAQMTASGPTTFHGSTSLVCAARWKSSEPFWVTGTATLFGWLATSPLGTSIVSVGFTIKRYFAAGDSITSYPTLIVKQNCSWYALRRGTDGWIVP